MLRWFVCSLLTVAALCSAVAQESAPTPPLGWNSWDAYGLSATEAEWKSNVAWFHQHLQPAGWQYVVLDEGWYLSHPENAATKGNQGYMMDSHGEFIPAPNRFPEGLAGLASYAHGLGLKFGIHIIRGIPKQAVEQNLPIIQSPTAIFEAAAAKGIPAKGAGNADALDKVFGVETWHAADAADTTDLCRWNPDNYGVRNNSAGQAYYDGLMRMYASWGVDFLKVDCISKPYKAAEIHMIRTAIEKTKRPIVLSLSPGPTPLEDAADVRGNAQMWRISDDVWDVWSDPKLTQGMFPQTVRNQFDVLADWMPSQETGHWPDADMLPIGTLGPRPGWGKPRLSRFTREETRSLLTLWAIARSPLILGSNLTEMTPELEAMLTNREWLAVDQAGSNPRRVLNQDETVVWRSDAAEQSGSYLAVFNTGDSQREVRFPWSAVSLNRGPHRVRDLWAGRDLGTSSDLTVTVPAHGAALYLIR